MLILLFYLEDGTLVFSDQENESFIDDSNCNNIQSLSFYRFANQSRNPVEAAEDDDGFRLDRRDLQPEIFHTIKKEQAEFDDFDDNQECVNRFKKAFVHLRKVTYRIHFLKLFYMVSFSS